MNIFKEWNTYIEQRIPETEQANMDSLTRHVNTFFYDIQKKHELEVNTLNAKLEQLADLFSRERDISGTLMNRLNCINEKEEFFNDTEEESEIDVPDHWYTDHKETVTKKYVDDLTISERAQASDGELA